ncbi:MAG: hypothetical protein AAF938_08795, partial [Myxococcota bacterium]
AAQRYREFRGDRFAHFRGDARVDYWTGLRDANRPAREIVSGGREIVSMPKNNVNARASALECVQLS